MTTLNEALRSDEDNVSIRGRIVCKQLFFTGRLILLVITMVDEDGNPYEAKSWSKSKALYVYAKFDEGDCVLLTTDRDSLVYPDQDYTQAKRETSEPGWFLSHMDEDDDELCPKNYFHCLTSVIKHQMSRRVAVSIMGLFQGMSEGPSKYSMGRHIAQGYYVTLKDDEGIKFVALVWKNLTSNTHYNFDLDDCKRNEPVLIINAREQDAKYQDCLPGEYVVTTVYPPVVGSSCVSPASYRNLTRGLQNARHSSRQYGYGRAAVSCY